MDRYKRVGVGAVEVRLGVDAALRTVVPIENERFSSESDLSTLAVSASNSRSGLGALLAAISGLMRRSKTPSLDHLIGAAPGA